MSEPDADRPRRVSARDPRSQRPSAHWPDVKLHALGWQTRRWLEVMEAEVADLKKRIADLEARVEVVVCGLVGADGTIVGVIGGITCDHIALGQYRLNHEAGVLPTDYVVQLTASSIAGDPSYAVIGEQTGTYFTVFTFRETGQPRDLAFAFLASRNVPVVTAWPAT